MNILISGGMKTINIVDALKGRFSSGGVDIVMEKDIEEIDKVLSRGDYFDRAIIMEQSWTRDGNIDDTAIIRNRIAEFCGTVSTRCSGDTICFFVTTTEDMAKIVVGEALALGENGVVLLKEPPYTVMFFTDLITKDREQWDKSVMYSINKLTGDDIAVESLDENWSDSKNIEDSIGFGERLKRLTDIDVDPSKFIDRMDEDDTYCEEDIEYDENIEDIQDSVENEELPPDDDDDIDIDDYINRLPQRDDVDDTECEDTYMNENSEDIKNSVEVVPDNTNNHLNELEIELIKDNKEDQIETGVTRRIRNKRRDKIENKRTRNKRDKIDTAGYTQSIDKLRVILDYYKNRGGSMVVTGAGGSGVSTIAYNIANTITNLGYSALLVDFDTKWRTQAYLSRDAYESVHTYTANSVSLLQSLGSINGAPKYANIIKPGLHLLTMGLGENMIEYYNIANIDKMTRLDISARSNYAFVIYDMPFEVATKHASTIIGATDNILIVCDSSTWGAMKMMLAITNIEDGNIQEEVFERAHICFNKFKGTDKILGGGSGSFKGVLKEVDNIIEDIIGITPDLQLVDMKITLPMEYDISYDDYWLKNIQYSDTDKGRTNYINLLDNIFNE